MLRVRRKSTEFAQSQPSTLKDGLSLRRVSRDWVESAELAQDLPSSLIQLRSESTE